MEPNKGQKRLEKALGRDLDRAKRAREAENEQLFPGTGKTTVMDKCVCKCLRDGGRVLHALPTAQQASRVRSKHPEADVDTCSGAFFSVPGRSGSHGHAHAI